jgi:hypothetical protein
MNNDLSTWETGYRSNPRVAGGVFTGVHIQIDDGGWGRAADVRPHR